MHKEIFNEFKGLLGFRSDTAESIYSLGVISATLGFEDEAEDYYREALRVKPNYWEAHYSLGVLLAGVDRFSEAIEELELAREGLPGSLCIYRMLIQVHRKCGEHEKVIGAYHAALENTQNETHTFFLHQGLGCEYYAQGRYKEAIAELREASRLIPSDPYLCVNIGAAYMAEGRLDEAACAFRQALEIKPNLVSALRNSGTLFLRTGQFSKAIEVLERAARIDASHPGTLRKLAIAYHRNGNDIPAQEHMRRAVELEELKCEEKD